MKKLTFYLLIITTLLAHAQQGKWQLKPETFLDPEIYKLNLDQIKERLKDSDKLTLNRFGDGSFIGTNIKSELFPGTSVCAPRK